MKDNMYELIKASSLKYSSSIAYIYNSNKVTYKTFLKKIDICSRAFYNLGVDKKNIVSLILPNSEEGIICLYALNKLGITVSIINPSNSISEIKDAIDLTNSRYVVLSDEVYKKTKNILDKTSVENIICLNVNKSNTFEKIQSKLKMLKTKNNELDDVISFSSFYSKGKLSNNEVNCFKNENAVIIYSGGTSGKQKGIVLTNKNINLLSEKYIKENGKLKNGETNLSVMPIFNSFGLICAFHSIFLSGATSIIINNYSIKKFDKLIIKHKPNIIECTPGMLESVPNSKAFKKIDLSFIKCILCMGDTISDKLNRRLNDFLYNHNNLIKIRNCYGMSECGIVTMDKEEDSVLGSVGVPLESVNIRIVDSKTNKECKTNVEGEICVNTPYVMKEYLNNIDETSNVLKKDNNKIWFHTGDIGYLDENGYLFFKSRMNRIIISNGYKIYPNQIEKIILEHPYVESCAVVGLPHPYKKEVVKAYIVLKKGLFLNSEIKKSIKAHCEKNISSYALPYAYGYRTELPKTIVGKISYRELINDKEDDIK